ncbi:MAG: energy transducer TonB [Acidobacteria bacterium]|nr:energy transducer TonB [Acidobacteriota bacterium]
MFDVLVETNGSRADARGRRKYFAVSALLVGALFLSAVIVSIYAADFDIGGDIEMARMLVAQVEPAQRVIEEPQPKQPAAANTSSTDRLPSRTESIARIDEMQKAPDSVSTVVNTIPPRPLGPYVINDRNSGPFFTGGRPDGTSRNSGSSVSSSSSGEISRPVPERVESIPPPPAIKKPTAPISKGVITGEAIYLPKPQYPATAMAVNAQGNVSVQVLIDEDGRVVSAKSVSGHPLLRAAAIGAARSEVPANAAFKPAGESDRRDRL